MGKVYQGNISLASAIKETGSQPLDDRLVVETRQDLLDKVFGTAVYNGMLVYIQDEKKYYFLKDKIDNTWAPLNEWFDNWFKWDEKTQSIYTDFNFYSKKNISAGGTGTESGGGTGGASSLIQLTDVNIEYPSLQDGDMIVWDPKAQSVSGEQGAWVRINKSEIKPNPDEFISSSVKLNTQDGITGGGFLIDNLTIGLEKLHEGGSVIKVNYDKYGRVTGGDSSININDVIGLTDEFTKYLKLNSTELQTVTGTVEFKNKVSFDGVNGIEFEGTSPDKKSSINLDEENNALQIESNVYTTGNISAGGKVSTTAGGGGGASTLGELINVNDAVDNRNETGGIQVLGRQDNELDWETVQLNYVHRQNISSDTWVIQHNLHRYPAVTVIDSGGSLVQGEIIYDSLDQVTLKFSCAFGGKAELR